MSGIPHPKLPFASLWNYALHRHGQDRRNHRGEPVSPLHITELAALCGSHAKAVHRWRAEGMTFPAADKAAIALGTHPCLIWGDAWFAFNGEESDEETEEICVAHLEAQAS